MTEEKLNALRQADTNLRDALHLDEVERPQMLGDLNERLMQRIAAQEKKPCRIAVWPWIAAACVAGVMIIWLTPPKDVAGDVNETPVITAKVEQSVAEPEQTAVQQPEVRPVQTPVKRMVAKVRPKKVEVSEPIADEPLLAQDVLAPVEQKKANEEPTVTLTERDIPITRPENYRYTPEEIALMKKQANEAYLKWAQLELEIAKYTLEQIAQSDY